MKRNLTAAMTAITLLTALAIPAQLAAQHQPLQNAARRSYTLVDLGTLGGPVSNLSPFQSVILNEAGTAVGGSDTSTRDPNYPNFNYLFAPNSQDPFIQHAFQWQNNTLTDLGALPGTNSSYANWVNESGVVVGNSENGSIDPLTGWPEIQPVVWQGGQILPLETFGGYESAAYAINKNGWVVGFTTNSTPDNQCLGNGQQCRAVLWRNLKQQPTDLGTLGTGNDAEALFVNDGGQVAGLSNTDPTGTVAHAFFWENGQKMQDIGTFGGNVSLPTHLNNRGQVVGSATFAGETTTHPYLWDQGKLTDLGTFGGTYGTAHWINDAGEVVGEANHTGDVIHTAFLWKNGELRDLGVVEGDKCSSAYAMNSKGQIVGISGDCDVGVHAFLWDRGHMIDLTTLVPPGVQLQYGININDHGEIAALGKVPNHFDNNFYALYDHAFLLIPCDDSHRDVEGCRDGAESNHDAAGQAIPRAPAYRNHMLGLGVDQRN